MNSNPLLLPQLTCEQCAEEWAVILISRNDDEVSTQPLCLKHLFSQVLSVVEVAASPEYAVEVGGVAPEANGA